MKEMSLQDIQQISLDILKDVHRFCADNNICYTLFGGTMIGAIRHKGFIPWDDDIDIAMPRPDYERFIATYKPTNGYELFASGTRKSYLAFSRVCEMHQTLVVNKRLPWTNQQTGVWIDIFPLDGAPDNIHDAEKSIDKLRHLWLKCSYARSAHTHYQDVKSFKQRAKLFIKKIAYNNHWNNIEQLKKQYIKECTKVEWGATNHFGNFSYLGYGIKEYQEMADFSTVILADFEDSQFHVCKGYDHLMRTKYGDYMQLPPMEKRVSNHALCTYYWR